MNKYMNITTPYDQEVKDCEAAYRDIDTQIREKTKDLRNKQFKASDAMRKAKNKKDKWIRDAAAAHKASGKDGYMSLILFWDDGTRFDTRKDRRLIDFKDMIFAKGLPTSFEVRG